MKPEDPETTKTTRLGDSKNESPESFYKPGGLFPLVGLRGWPIKITRVRAVGKVFAHDVVHPTLNGAVASGGVPGRTTYCGVAFTSSLGDSPRSVMVIDAVGTMFASRGSGDLQRLRSAMRRSQTFANFAFDAGDQNTWISGHKVDLRTAANYDELDARILRLLPRELEEVLPAIQLTLNRTQTASISPRTKGASRRLIQTKEAFDRDIGIVIDQLSMRGHEISSISEETAAAELGTIIHQPDLDARQLRRLKSYYYGNLPWSKFRMRFRPKNQK